MIIETLLLIASLRSSTDTLAPIDYLIGAEVRANHKFVEAQFDNEYERERGDNFYNYKGSLDLKYLRGEVKQNQPRNVSTQKAILKYPLRYKYQGLEYYGDFGLSNIWDHWDEYKGAAFFNRAGLAHDYFYIEYTSDVFIKKDIGFESQNFNVGIKTKYLQCAYRMDLYDNRPSFHWLLFKVRVK